MSDEAMMIIASPDDAIVSVRRFTWEFLGRRVVATCLSGYFRHDWGGSRKARKSRSLARRGGLVMTKQKGLDAGPAEQGQLYPIVEFFRPP